MCIHASSCMHMLRCIPACYQKVPGMLEISSQFCVSSACIPPQAKHPFCVKLLGAYQDKKSLYLLQVGASRSLTCKRVLLFCSRSL